MSYKFKLIDKSSSLSNESFYCKMCDYPLISSDDFYMSENYSCCHDCYLSLIQSKLSDWKKGWRPKQKMIDSYKQKKKDLYKKLGE